MTTPPSHGGLARVRFPALAPAVYEIAMTKQEFFTKAAKAFKLIKLRSSQRALGTDIMDDFAVALNSTPTHEEEEHVKTMWRLFEHLGAQLPQGG